MDSIIKLQARSGATTLPNTDIEDFSLIYPSGRQR
jgi:hypothetical protein